MQRILIILTALLLALAPATTEAKKQPRTSKTVKQERQRTAREIEKTKQQISQNTAETRRQLNRLTAIDAEITRQSIEIDRLKAELAQTKRRIGVLVDSINDLQTRTDALRKSYAASLRDMHDRRGQMNKWAFVFAADNFTQAWRRLRYLDQLQQSQTVRQEQLKENIARLGVQRARLDTLMAEQNTRLAALSTAQAGLQKSQGEAQSLVKSLKREGSSLKKVLTQKQRQAQALDDELDRIIAEEARKAEEARLAEERRKAEEARRKAEEARKKAEEASQQSGAPTQQPAKPDSKKKQETKPTESTYDRQAEADRKLTGSFAQNKGRLLCPVAGQYRVVSAFGRSQHPELSKVEMQNNGIDLEVPAGASARAVFDGTVSSIFRMEGYNNIVILRHGEYLTVYAGIDHLAVKKGDKVKAGQGIGTIVRDDDGRYVLHFEIRLEKQKLNPAEWFK